MLDFVFGTSQRYIGFPSKMSNWLLKSIKKAVFSKISDKSLFSDIPVEIERYILGFSRNYQVVCHRWNQLSKLSGENKIWLSTNDPMDKEKIKGVKIEVDKIMVMEKSCSSTQKR